MVEGVAAEKQQHIKFLEQQLPLETLREVITSNLTLLQVFLFLYCFVWIVQVWCG